MRVTLTTSEGEDAIFDRAEDRHGWEDSWVEGSPASRPSQSKGLRILREKNIRICQTVVPTRE